MISICALRPVLIKTGTFAIWLKFVALSMVAGNAHYMEQSYW